MIVLKNVTKIYKIKHKSDCVAVNNVSLTLPDKGMVFIIGKSGSGKSTLLNLLGGLDRCSSGEIVVDGNVLSKLSSRSLTKYRSSYVGFIFQDYHVLDNFTVKENVELALDIASSENEERVNKVLNQVDLSMYADRYPSELSGGQKQRIAIARAMVKDSKAILCDEPTGNLDNKTSNQILNILKKISLEKLVVIVSHNMVDANNYADRIIELYDGQIVRDRRRSDNYNNEFRIENDVVYLPHYRDLSSNELIILNEEIEKNDNLTFKQVDNRFYPTVESKQEMNNVQLSSSRMSRKTISKLFKIFFRHKKVGIAISVFLVSLLVVCFAIFQSFLNFNSNKELSKILNKYDINCIPLQKGTFNEDHNIALGSLYKVTDEDIQAFYDNGYKGNVYKKYNNTFIFASSSSNKVDNESAISVSRIFSMFYATETLGVINCSKEYLVSLYGVDGELNMLAGSLEGKDYGVVIPDYLADSLIFYKNKELKYDDIIGEYYNGSYKQGYINGVFDTDYEEKYDEIIKMYEDAFNDVDLGNLYDELIDNELYNDFLANALTYLGYGYSIVDNYKDTLINKDFRNYIGISGIRFEIDDEKNYFTSATCIFMDDDLFNKAYPSYAKYVGDLKENEIVLGLSFYNQMFGTSYTSISEFTPCDVVVSFYENYNSNNLICEKQYKIVGVIPGNTKGIIEVDDNFDLYQYDVIEYGMILDNQDNISAVSMVADERGFLINSVDATKMGTINRVLEVFDDFFLFIELFFLLIMFIFLINIGISSIKKNKYDIGVLRAIGASGRDIMRIFIRQSIIVCLSICIVANIGIFLGEYVANFILISAFEKILEVSLHDLVLISYIPNLVIKDLFYIVIISFLSFVIPQMLLFKIKPIDIIRAKE